MARNLRNDGELEPIDPPLRIRGIARRNRLEISKRGPQVGPPDGSVGPARYVAFSWLEAAALWATTRFRPPYDFWGPPAQVVALQISGCRGFGRNGVKH